MSPDERLKRAGFRTTRSPGPGLAAYVSDRRDISLIVSVETHQGKQWAHVSIASMNDRSPTWSHLVEAKNLVLGEEALAIQILPPKSKHVNFHPTCFHIFSPIGFNPLPDFTRGTGML